MALLVLCPLQIMMSAWPSLACVAPGDAATTPQAASAVSAIKASPWTAQATAAKVESGFGWSPDLRGGPEGGQANLLSLSVLQMWMNVTGPIAASTAVRMSWGATAAAAPRVSPHTLSGASVWVSGRSGEEAGAPTRTCLEWVTRDHPPLQDIVKAQLPVQFRWASLEGNGVPFAGESGDCRASMAKFKSTSYRVVTWKAQMRKILRWRL